MPNYATVRRWEAENLEFRALSMRAKQEGTHFMADDCIRIADDKKLGTADKRIMVDTRLRLIGKWHRQVYGERIEHSGEVSMPVRFIVEGSPADAQGKLIEGVAREPTDA